jgi:hypothetical protein
MKSLDKMPTESTKPFAGLVEVEKKVIKNIKKI